jgi:hypothetical protein
MKNRPTVENVLWMVAGAVILAAFLLLSWHFHEEESPTQQLAFKATRVDLVGRMELSLTRASEAEKSAVLAITDADSQRFADQARTATAEVERERGELAKLLEARGAQGERDLFAQFSQAFADLQRIDDEVLRLAVKNTNLKAYALAFGPAADALAEMDAALARVLAKATDGPDAKRLTALAFGARVAVLHIHILLAPHIAEESDPKMDALETSMRQEELQARKDLHDLAAMPRLKGDTDVATATSSFVRYEELKSQILALSRENTNVRSLALSLNQKRKAMILSLDALNALRQAIMEEPIAGVAYGRPSMLR